MAVFILSFGLHVYILTSFVRLCSQGDHLVYLSILVLKKEMAIDNRLSIANDNR